MFESSHIVAAIVAVAASALCAFEIFAGSSYRGSIRTTGAKIDSSYREFREIGGKIIELE